MRLQNTSTHLEKDYSARLWTPTRARRPHGPRSPDTMQLVGNKGAGGACKRSPQMTPRRPCQRPPLRPRTSDGKSTGAATNARKKRRLLPLPDGPQTGASEPTPGSLGEGLAGGRRLFCSVGGMCCEGRGLIGPKEHLVRLPPWCARAPQAPMPSPACAHKGQKWVPGQLQSREGVLGGREGTPISANLPRFPTTPVCGKWSGVSMEAVRGARRAGVCSMDAGCARSSQSKSRVPGHWAR